MDARIDDIVMRTLEREREARFQNVHQMKTQVDAATQPGVAAPPATAAALAPNTARFANVSLLCTALSLPVAMFGFGLLIPLWVTDRHGKMVPGGLLILAAVFLLLLAAAIVPGAVLAMRALREIRSSGGEKGGFMRAIVAALSWPAILVVAMTSFGIAALIAESDERNLWRTLLGFLLLAASGTGVVMIRKIHGWAKSAHSVEWPLKQVWRFAAAAFVALACLGVSLRGSSKAANSEPSGTKMELKTLVAAGKKATFRVVRINAEGNETPVELGGSIFSAGEQDFHTTLQIISKDSKKNGVRQELSASYTALSGETYSKTVFLDEKWKFNTSGRGSSQLIEGNKERFELATRDDWRGKKLESLFIELTGASQKTAVVFGRISAAMPPPMSGS